MYNIHTYICLNTYIHTWALQDAGVGTMKDTLFMMVVSLWTDDDEVLLLQVGVSCPAADFPEMEAGDCLLGASDSRFNNIQYDSHVFLIPMFYCPLSRIHYNMIILI